MSIQVAPYHTTSPPERAVAIMMSLGALSAVSYAASSGVKAYREWQASLPEEPPKEEQVKEKVNDESQQKGKEKESDGARENVFAKWFGVGVGSKYYEGGFEDTMTRSEAALILGVRESSDPKRIKDAHRKLLILNHPDTGGSTYMAGKINEAKELLLKGRRS
jgi:hypothetical protein